VIIADVRDERLASCKPFGADYAINSADERLEEAVAGLTGGKGADVVVTANPAPQAQAQATNIAAKGGRIAFFGGLPHDRSQVALDTNLIHYKGLTIIGTSGFAPRHFYMALDLIARGKIQADKLVTHILPIDDFAKGVELAKEGKALKVVYKVNFGEC